MDPVVVVTRVACTWGSRGAPSEKWVDSRRELLREVAAASLEDAHHYFRPEVRWFWRTCRERFSQVCDIALSMPVGVEVVLEDELTAPGLPPRLVSFRMDSDDAWLPAALDSISQMGLEDGHVLSCSMGWQLDWQTGRAARYQNKSPVSPFLAVGRTRANALQVDFHTRRKPVALTRYEHRAFLQVIHGKNEHNQWRDGQEVDTQSLLSYFGVERQW